MKSTLIIAMISANLVACASDQQNGDTIPEMTSTAVPVPDEILEDVQQGGYHYDLEWTAFKEAVYAKNAEDLNVFFPEGGIGIDAETLLLMLSEDWVIEEMKKTNYEDLTDSEYNGNYAKEFGASIAASDDEGNIYESGIYLYFEESLTGLKLVNVLAAG